MKNPLITDSDGVPICYGSCDENDKVCMEDCPADLQDQCMEKTLSSAKGPRRPDGWYTDAIEDIKQDKFKLPVLQPRPSPSVYDPPRYEEKPRVAPVNYWDNQSRTPSYAPTSPWQSTANSQTVQQLQINLNRPHLTDEQYIDIYGCKPAINPIVPGQFEGESWYARLGKEWVLRSLQYSVQVASQLVIDMVSRIRWAPKQDS